MRIRFVKDFHLPDGTLLFRKGLVVDKLGFDRYFVVPMENDEHLKLLNYSPAYGESLCWDLDYVPEDAYEVVKDEGVPLPPVRAVDTQGTAIVRGLLWECYNMAENLARAGHLSLWNKNYGHDHLLEGLCNEFNSTKEDLHRRILNTIKRMEETNR